MTPTPTPEVVVPLHLLSEAAGLLDCEGYGPIAAQLNSLIAAASPQPVVAPSDLSGLRAELILAYYEGHEAGGDEYDAQIAIKYAEERIEAIRASGQDGLSKTIPDMDKAIVAPHPDLTAARAVDACGGTFPTPKNDYDSGWQRGHEAALDAAADAVKPFDERMDELLTAAQDALQCYDALLDDFRMGDPEILKALAEAIDKATGASA